MDRRSEWMAEIYGNCNARYTRLTAGVLGVVQDQRLETMPSDRFREF
jgi:hypothetical protein